MKNINVVAAIIIKNNRIFCAQRANKGELALKWEFPGGKIEDKETMEEALEREIREELDSVISVKKHFMQVRHQYVGFHLTMDSFICELEEGDLKLSEHVNSTWLELSDKALELDWAAADIPIIEKLLEK